MSTSLITNATGRTNYNGWEILGKTALSVGIGLVAGVLGGTKVNGATLGRNSFMSVWKSGLTKLSHGTAARMSARVMLKGLAGVATMRSTAGLISGIISAVWGWIQYLFFGNQQGIGYA